MIFAGCDIGSLTGEAVIVSNNSIISTHIIRIKSNPENSAFEVMTKALENTGLSFNDITYCCSTGYGRDKNPFSNLSISEISCHGLGAHWLNKSIRTVIDIGGQDCKVISIDEKGMIIDFIMNDKCAAGTGRNLEILAKTINIKLEDLGKLSLKSRKPLILSNKCSVFMELEVLQHLYSKKRINNIVHGINDAVARRVACLAGAVDLQGEFAITGGVSKNIGVVKGLEEILKIKFSPLPIDPQLVGALGAAVFARNEALKLT